MPTAPTKRQTSDSGRAWRPQQASTPPIWNKTNLLPTQHTRSITTFWRS